MICPNCGRNIPDGSVCPCSMGGALSSNPALHAIKTIGSSGKFLAAAILLTAVPVLTIVSALLVKQDLSRLLFYLYELDLDPEVLYMIMSNAQRTPTVTAAMSALPAILTAAALWMTYTTCGNRHSGNISTAGLTICKVLSVITIVLYALLALLLVVSLGLVIVAGAANAFDDEELGTAITAIAVVLLVVLAGATALAICYQACIIKTVNRIKATAITGVADNRVPGFLIGMNYFTGVCSAISGVAALFSSPVAGVAALAGAAAAILFAMLLSQYRSAMTMLLYPPVQPVYPQQPTPPQNPWG